MPNPQASPSESPNILPIRRDLHFKLPAERVADWHDEGRHVSHFFNALSLFFPDGERFFIHAVRHYRERITDPALAKAATAFIGQEAMHGREHTECNEMLDQAGLPGMKLQSFVFRLTERLKLLPKAVQLAITIALEHLTAIMANALLQDRRVVGNAEPHFSQLWRWHALEETEHKAVAYDVWVAMMPRNVFSYLLRTSTLVLASLIFWPLVIAFMWRLTRSDAQARAEKGGWRRTFRFLFMTPGPLRRAISEWFDYFKPGFHPWQHDNRQFLGGIEPLLRDIEGSARAA